MDADTLRLILIVLGIFLILGIYFWEKRKRKTASLTEDVRVEPTLNAIDETAASGMDRAEEPPMTQESAESAWSETRVMPDSMSAMHAEDANAVKDAPSMRAEKRQPAAPQAKSEATAADTGTEIPSLILQINISSGEKRFQGPDILRAIKSVNLSTGSMNIFHRRAGDEPKGSVLFSMASMVEPGTFPLDAIDDFTTPGLTLFAQLPGPDDGLSIFNDLIDTAERIADELDGELQDDTHSRLTRQTIEHLRSQVVEHRRHVQLAKSRAK